MTTVGELFSQKRKAKKISLTRASHDLLIKKEHLDAIEKGEWQSLPEPPFTKGFVKNYAKYLGLDENKILAFYRREYDEAKYPHKQSPFHIKKRIMITPNRFAGVLLIIAALFFVSYLLIQYFSILSAPKIEVLFPPEDLTTSVPAVQISGHTEKEATVSINGEFVPVNDEGNFSYQYQLKEGRNEIQIIASKRLSPKTKVTKVARLVR